VQEGVKQHEGGQQHHNPFDMFASFFGGGGTSSSFPVRTHHLIAFQDINSKYVAVRQ
jgi:hypothetical protein